MRISRAPIYDTRWQHRALYNNTNHTHTHTHSVERGDGQGCEKQFRTSAIVPLSVSEPLLVLVVDSLLFLVFASCCVFILFLFTFSV